MQAQDHAAFDAGTVETGARSPVAARAVIPDGMDDAPVRFVAPDTGTALAWRPYRLHIGARLVLGRTDENGFTAQLSGPERVLLSDWEVE
jgi:hypothetical protein